MESSNNKISSSSAEESSLEGNSTNILSREFLASQSGSLQTDGSMEATTSNLASRDGGVSSSGVQRVSYDQESQSTLRVAIAGADFPSMRLSADFADKLQVALKRGLEFPCLEVTMLNFHEYKLDEQLGIIMVTCCNERAKLWLFAAVGILSPFEGINLQIFEVDSLTRLYRVIAFIPGAPVDRLSILNEIERSTPELLTGLWKVERAISVPGQGTKLILDVDGPSLAKLSKMRFEAYYGIVKISFWDPRRKQGDPNAALTLNASSSDEDQEMLQPGSSQT
ncbi:hypothetical protein ILUMI_26632 [Ignelater luminosus]|uniref:DUF4780 domain-containing protein n=1 Tax=Ignelater luminosus TaxID=2038154 RepID=A0A8K0C461_IGNLU|nr:hypothetical protein ILUMI_26632 [Ignelater luminosus]